MVAVSARVDSRRVEMREENSIATHENQFTRLSVEECRERIRDYVIEGTQKDFHQPSGLHIFFCNEVGALGVHGCHRFSGKAYDSYYEKINKLIGEAEKDELELWLQRFIEAVSSTPTDISSDKSYENSFTKKCSNFKKTIMKNFKKLEHS